MARRTRSQTLRSTSEASHRADPEMDLLRARETKQLRILSKSLAALLTAGLLRTVIHGLDGRLAVAITVTGLLLVASLWLTARLRGPDGS